MTRVRTRRRSAPLAVASAILLLEKGELRFIARSWASASPMSSLRGPTGQKFECLLVYFHPGVGHGQRRLGVIDVLLADRAACRLLGQSSEPVELTAGIGRVGFGRTQVGLGLGDLFGSAAVVQAVDACRWAATWASACITCGSRRLVSSRASDLPLLDVIAFLDQHFGDSLAVVKGQLNLPQVDVAVQLQHRNHAGWTIPPPDAESDCQ